MRESVSLRSCVLSVEVEEDHGPVDHLLVEWKGGTPSRLRPRAPNGPSQIAKQPVATTLYSLKAFLHLSPCGGRCYVLPALVVLAA